MTILHSFGLCARWSCNCQLHQGLRFGSKPEQMNGVTLSLDGDSFSNKLPYSGRCLDLDYASSMATPRKSTICCRLRGARAESGRWGRPSTWATCRHSSACVQRVRCLHNSTFSTHHRVWIGRVLFREPHAAKLPSLVGTESVHSMRLLRYTNALGEGCV